MKQNRLYANGSFQSESYSYNLTCAEEFRRPHELPSGSGYVTSAANSNPTGKYPVMKNPRRNAVPNIIHILIDKVIEKSTMDINEKAYITKVVALFGRKSSIIDKILFHSYI